MPRFRTTALFLAPLTFAGLTALPAVAGPTLPNDFESQDAALLPLFSYFGGVNGFGAQPSPTTVHSGDSLRCWANFRHDSFFHVAGFSVGTFEISSPALAVPASADTFSITVRAPSIPQTLAMIITLKEDDTGDGIIDTGGADDQWESAPIFLPPGSTAVYNLPFAAFEDADPDSGNNVINFTTSATLAYAVTFETRSSFPGGIVEAPTEFLIDHVGLYVGNQTIPTGCAGDFNSDGAVTPQDLFDFLTAWFASAPAADRNASGTVTVQDLFDYLAAFFTPC